MKNIIVGTAGHVDHGKTCLIKSLTGTDTDRLKEEKKRGITIENGFADMICGPYNISIIDVPGHEKFLKNMLTGIGGIDLVLLIIGLDEGVMPQTSEHFQILKMLKIEHGIIVYTKKDLVEDEEWIELVKDDVESMVKGSFLEGAPSIEVSAYENYHIEELKQLIIESINDDMLKNHEAEMFRLPIDRVFTIDGYGTIVTGTLIEGSIRVGDEIIIYPDEIKAKVRNLQVHNENVDTAWAGQRTAVNLTSVKKDELRRGQVLSCKDSLEPSKIFDVRLEIFDNINKVVYNNSRVHFYCGAAQGIGKVVLLDRDEARAGDACYAQVRMEEDFSVKMDDRFIIRFYSPMVTIGGGKILDGHPLKHKRFDKAVLDSMHIKDTASIKEIVELTIKENSYKLLNCRRLRTKLRIEKRTMDACLEELFECGKIKVLKKEYYVHREYLESIYEFSRNIMEQYHEENALSSGMATELFRSKISKRFAIEDSKVLDDILISMVEDNILKHTNTGVALKEFEIKYTPEFEAMRSRIINLYKCRSFEMPSIEEVLETENDKKNCRHIIDTLVEENILVRLNYQYCINRDCLEWALSQLKLVCNQKGNITLAEFRDIIGTSRKYAMEILEYLDKEKVTKKIEDFRVLV